jgi:hypothetical protein
VTPVSSVTAFLARARSGADREAADLLAALDLDDDARAAVDAQRVSAAARRQWLEARTGRVWTAAQLAHVESRALVAIRRQLQAKGLYA